MDIRKTVLDKFLRYIAIDTQSDDSSTTYPSTQKQFDLLNLLVNELKEIGLQDVNMDEKGYVMGTLPSNISHKVPVIGFLAHVDTSPDMPGKDVKPQFVEKYDGSDILLSKELNLYLKPSDFPELLDYKGQTLITTDGTTLLGADNKAGIAEIMTAMEFLVKNPSVPHGTIKVGFTPDEEIGRGVDHFDVKKFGAEYAYTIDGGAIGELEFENFNAAMAKITIQGRNIHPGYAKDKMINSLIVATELNTLLPVFERPEFTQDYEGFYHLMKIEGSVEKASMQYIIRDHDKVKFEKKKEFMKKTCDFMNEKYGQGVVTLELKDQYFNMREKVEPVYHVVEKAMKAMELAGVKPKVKPIRGGTDGARLSYMGLPCPNIFAGGLNFHGKFEFVPVETMEKSVEVIVKLAELYAEK